MNSSISLKDALSIIGKNTLLKEKMIKLLILAEAELDEINLNVRNEITGPIVDALQQEGEIQNKIMSNGIKYSFYYQGNIHRELVMSNEEYPDHVWEPQTTKLLTILAKKCDGHFLIGGAYSGDQALFVAKELLKNKELKLFLFEPNTSERKQLKLNMENNGFTNFHLDERGLWSCDDILLSLAENSDQSHAGSQVVNEDYEFKSVSITSFCNEQGIENISCIMLDIEGGELEALKGAEFLLNKEPNEAPIIIFELHSLYSDWSNGLEKTDIVKYLKRFGYVMFAIRDFQGNWSMPDQPIELVGIENAYIDGPHHGFNIIALKDISELKKKGGWGWGLFRFREGVSPKYLRHRDPTLHSPILSD